MCGVHQVRLNSDHSAVNQVCFRTRFSMFSSGVRCSVCKYSVCRQCVSSPVSDTSSVMSLPSSSSSSSPSSLSSRLGTLFSKRRLCDQQKPNIMCRPCAQFVQQVCKMSSLFNCSKYLLLYVSDESYDRGRRTIQQYAF